MPPGNCQTSIVTTQLQNGKYGSGMAENFNPPSTNPISIWKQHTIFIRIAAPLNLKYCLFILRNQYLIYEKFLDFQIQDIFKVVNTS